VALAHFPLGAAARTSGRQRGSAASGCTMPSRGTTRKRQSDALLSATACTRAPCSR
jgi:hypothetical protein